MVVDRLCPACLVGVKVLNDLGLLRAKVLIELGHSGALLEHTLELGHVVEVVVLGCRVVRIFQDQFLGIRGL